VSQGQRLHAFRLGPRKQEGAMNIPRREMGDRYRPQKSHTTSAALIDNIGQLFVGDNGIKVELPTERRLGIQDLQEAQSNINCVPFSIFLCSCGKYRDQIFWC